MSNVRCEFWRGSTDFFWCAYVRAAAVTIAPPYSRRRIRGGGCANFTPPRTSVRQSIALENKGLRGAGTRLKAARQVAGRHPQGAPGRMLRPSLLGRRTGDAGPAHPSRPRTRRLDLGVRMEVAARCGRRRGRRLPLRRPRVQARRICLGPRSRGRTLDLPRRRSRKTITLALETSDRAEWRSLTTFKRGARCPVPGRNSTGNLPSA